MKTRIFLSLMLLICFCLSVTQAQNINRVEYFIDQDPGFGKGTALVINPNIVVSGTYSIPLSSMEIPNGLHLLAVRAKDVNNNWSVTSISTFMKDNITSATPLSYISYAEYFIDNDPGFGKGTTVNLEKSSQINNFSFTIALAQDLPKGVHYLNFRVRDLSGKWSVVAIKPIFKEDSPLEMTLSNIAKVEYFIDKDPGFGKGYDVAFTTGTNINNLSFTANLSGVLSGEHQMFIRVKDTKGNWSSVGLRKFTLCNDATSIKINVPSSTTVCQGQSIQLSVPSGYRYQWQKNGNNIYDAIANTYQVTESGQYQVAIVNNSCLFTSNAVDIVVTAFPEKPSLPVNSVGICAGNSIVLDANGCDGILTWYDGNNIVDKLVSPSVTTNYRATCTKNGCTSEKSDILKVTVNTLLSAPIISSSLNDICQGTTVTLTASGCNGIVKWNDDSEGNTLTVKPNNTTTYSAFCKTNNCTSTNTSIIIKVKNTTANQTVINADNQTICNGSTVNLSSSGCTGSILWSTGAITKDIRVSPSVNTTYSVICTQNNCIGTSVNAVKISVIPSIAALTISAKDVSICKGKSTILSAGFCYGVTQWNNGDIGRSITVSPTISTTYTAVCLNNGCSSSVSNAIKINVSECENTAISITAIEYFIDKDPGLGKGTNVSITNASAITKDFNVSLPSTLSDGIHTLSVRAKDSKGSWTSVAIRPFVKQSLSQSILSTITQLEYFYDKDPGYGKGTQITVAKQNTIDNLNITLPISSSLSDGLHFLTIRAKDSKNSWGVSATKVFLKNVISNVALSNLTQLEYFVDIDPGNGKGIGIPFTSGQTLSNLTFDVNLKNLNLRDGEHFLQLRAKDNKGNWSSVGTKIFQSSNELVSIGSVANSYCNQQTVNIPYTVKGTFESDNEFIVQVSNSDGLFSDYPTEIGRLNSKINASIASTIPNFVGDKYRIRIKSTNPVRYSDSKTIVFKQKPNRPTISNGSAIDFCKGGNVILSASSDEGNIRWSNGLISTQINASKVGEYYAISTLNGCSSDISNIITVTNNVPSPQAPLISSTNSVICSGQTAILRATGCLGTVIWSNGTSGININVSPTITTKYKAICSVQNCISDSSLATTITVLPKPTQPKITVSNVSICAGGSSVLTSSACTGGVLSWTGGLTGNSITVSPTVTKTYKALCTVNGCKSDSSLATTITILPKPIQPKITANNSSICVGGSSVLTATACTNGVLTWTGGLTGNSITVSPTTTKSYKVLCTINGCKSDSSLATTITVLPKPSQPKITASNSSICAGGSSVLTSTACTNGTLTWTGGLSGNSITVSPTATKSYKALCTIGGCKSDSSLATTITVVPKPSQPKITASNSSICVGGSSVLTATACTNGVLTWTGGLTGNSITVSPTSTKSYKVLCTIGSCKSDSSLATTITILPKLIQPIITASNATVCAGSSSVLTSTACTNGVLTWTGGLTGSSITVSPTATKSYKALCTIGSCKSDSSLATTINVLPKPTQPKITASNSSICVGGNSVLTSTACTGGTLTWTGGLTGSSITVSPTATKAYKVLCTIGGCKSDSSLASTITVTPKPTQPKITASNSSICVGGNSVLTSTACVGGTLTWTGGLTGNSITVSPTSTRSYKALCTIGSCKSDSSLATTITILPKPTQPKITASNSSICVGSSSVLTATACTNGTLTWTGGLTGNSITVSPTSTRSYKALCTINGCKSDSSLATTITVVPKPTQPKITASNSSICVGSSSVLTSTACVGGTLTWTGGLTGSSITVSPTATKAYKVLCTIGGCKSDSSLASIITVTPKPTQPKITSSNSSICVGGSSVLTSTACVGGTLTWTGGLTGNSITVSPTATKAYKVLCTIGGCKSDSSLATTITVIPKPTQPKITASNATVCAGSSSVLTSTACVGGTLTWTGGLTGNSITVSPTATKAYKVLCTIGGCKSDSSLATTITVIPKPTQPKITASNATVCAGSSSILTSTACVGGRLTWTGGLTGNSITVSPTATKSYKVLCTIGGCKSDSSLATTITITPKPTQPKITASNSSICVGGNSVLTSTACVGGTLTWTGGLTGNSITVSPTATKSYKVLCTINGCKSDSSLATTITVTPKPNAPVISSNVTCTNSVTKQWDKTLKGNGSENIRVMLNLPDGGYIIGGENYSDITSSLDYWLVKTDAKGNKVWEKTFGGTKDENLASMLATADGGYVLLGISNSDISADKSEASRGTNDYWVIKVNANGTKVWDKTFGGNAQDTPKSIVATSDGGFILGGQSLSGLSGDKTEASKGTYDFWIVKINANGSKVWDKTFGGDNEEYLSKILITADGGYLLGGHSSSGISGNKSETSKGASDYWIVKINANGSKVWDKAFGGNSVEYLGDISTISDGGFLLVGDSYSGLSGDKTQSLKGDTDYWAVKINANGLKIWDKAFGGNSSEYFKAIANTNDGGFILAGYSFSGISGDKSEASNGNSDYWAIRIDANGVKVWDKAFGGNSHDMLSNIITSNDGGFLLGGTSLSGLSGDKTDVGTQYQYCWIVKASVCNPNNITSSQKPTLTATGCTGTVTWSNGATGNSITVSPSTATTYTATCTVNGCVSTVSNSITVSVTVTKPTTPTITASNATICTGTNATLTASACTGGTLTWTGGLTGNSITVSPTATKTYKVVCSQNGIISDSSAAVTVTVNPKPTQPKNTVSNATICAGGSAVLSATACSGGTLTWTGGLTGASITVSPTATKSYKAICAINGCKSDSSLATTVNVLAKPNAPTITSKSTTVSSVVKQWEKTYGGNWYDNLSCVVPTQDGGYLLGGNSSSNIISGEKSEDIVGGWIVKINADGNKIWDKAYKEIFLAANGGIGLRSIIPTSDGGFLLGATSITNTGAIDFWLIKIDANGNKIWDKTFGGIAEDYLVKIISTSDGGFLIGGSSLSSGTNGYLDYLVIKVDANGNKQWTKFYGAAGHETLSSIIKTSDGGYLLAGDSHSNIGGDKSENSKGLYSSDYWIVKIDANGTKIWDKTLGGDNNDASPDIVQTSDGDFLLGGSSRSSISGEKSENYRGDIGYDDFWIIKLDSKGTKIWDKTFGGSMNDKLIKIMTTADGGFLLGGSSYSGIGLNKSEDTQGHWLIKIDANGQKIWDKTFGGIGTDPGIYDVSPTSDGGYIFGGSSKSSNRQMDYWIVKIKENKTTTTTLAATGCTGTVTWSNGSTGNSITVSPSTATTYTATCTVNGCVSSASNSIKVSPDLTTTSTGSMYEAARLDANPSKSDSRIEFKVFPNPATDELNVETDLDGEATFQLYNMIGQQVLESTFVKKTKIPLINFSKGSYFYLIQYQEYRKTGKVLLE